MHTTHFHGETLRFEGRNVDVVEVLPGMSAVADMAPGNVGSWLVHCHVEHHIHQGMQAFFQIFSSKEEWMNSSALPISAVETDSSVADHHHH